MSNSASFDSFEALLYAAMKYVGAIELEQYNSADDSIVFSPKTKKRLIKRIENERKYKERHLVYRPIVEVLKRIAVALLVATTVLFTACMCVEKIRDAIVEFFVEWYDEYISVKIHETDVYNVNKQEGIVEPNKLSEYKEPKGIENFERVAMTKNDFRYYVEYNKEDDGKRLSIMYVQEVGSKYNFFISQCETEMVGITVNGYEGIKTEYYQNELKIVTVCWKDDNHTYILSGNVEYQQLLDIANSIY